MGSAMRIEVDGKVFVEESITSSVPSSVLPEVRVIPVAAKFEVTAMDYCLDVWTSWQRQDDSRLGWHKKSAMLESDYSDDECEADAEAIYSSMDVRVAEAVEAMMRGLPRNLDWAIRRRCNIASVWRFPSLIFEDVLKEAEAALEVLLKKNIATRSLFH